MVERSSRATESTAGEALPAAERPLAVFLQELAAIRATGSGVPETSYYPALSNLFNAVGDGLKPKVRCVIHTRNRGSTADGRHRFDRRWTPMNADRGGHHSAPFCSLSLVGVHPRSSAVASATLIGGRESRAGLRSGSGDGAARSPVSRRSRCPRCGPRRSAGVPAGWCAACGRPIRWGPCRFRRSA